jgi:hypothetical protein
MAKNDSKPTRRQLRYLRVLAQWTGTTFIAPTTRRQASDEIERLRQRSPSLRHEREADRRAVSRELAEQQPPSAVRPDEVSGYGGEARWAGG